MLDALWLSKICYRPLRRPFSPLNALLQKLTKAIIFTLQVLVLSGLLLFQQTFHSNRPLETPLAITSDCIGCCYGDARAARHLDRVVGGATEHTGDFHRLAPIS